VRLLRDEAGAYTITLRLIPQDVGEVTRLPVWMPALRKDRWLADLLATLHAGDWPITKATIQFERPGRKVFARLTYERPVPTAETREGQATLGPVEADGALWLRANGRTLSLSDRVYHLRTMKDHYAGILARLRRDLGKRGRRQDHRRAVLRAGTFERWSEGPLHVLSRMIVDWCVRERIATLVWAIGEDGSLPWDRLSRLVCYKAQEAGLAVSQITPSAAPTDALRNGEDGAASEGRTKRGRVKPLQELTDQGGA
jgi:hypothetical protein